MSARHRMRRSVRRLLLQQGKTNTTAVNVVVANGNTVTAGGNTVILS